MKNANIMIVDDTPANLDLLEKMLKEHGYKVSAFPRGFMALKAAERRPPDLILLDINMPEMTGYEVCEKLKANPDTSKIPVIFISALTETMDKVRAFQCGGVDYVTKPFQEAEVSARVHTHLKIRKLQCELEQKIEERDRLDEMRESLVQMIVHDLRSPLQGVKGYAELIALDADQLTENHADYIQSIITNASIMHEMVSDLLDITRLEQQRMPLRKTQEDLNKLAIEAVKSLGALTEGRVFKPELSADPVYAYCDGQVIRRVIANLLGNAFKYTLPKQAVHLIVQMKDDKPCVIVSDHGPGIAEEYQQRIFEKFGQVETSDSSRSKYSTGLGLSFAKMAVEAHGGRIGMESKIGEGSTFWVILPGLDVPKPSAPKEQTTVDNHVIPTENSKYILVVDDDPHTCDLFKQYLQTAGHRVDTTECGKDAIRRVHETPYDLVVADIIMPGKEGMELLMELREEFTNLPVIMFSGGLPGVHIDLLQIAKFFGANATLKKPISREELLLAVNKVLDID